MGKPILRIGDKCIVRDDSGCFSGKSAKIVEVFDSNLDKVYYGIHVEGYDYGPATWGCFERTGKHSNWHRATLERKGGFLTIVPKKGGLVRFLEEKCK